MRISQNRGVTEPGRLDALRGKPCIAFGIVADLSAMRAAIDLKHHLGGGHKKVPQDEGLRRVKRLLNAYGGRRQDLAQQGIERSLPAGQMGKPCSSICVARFSRAQRSSFQRRTSRYCLVELLQVFRWALRAIGRRRLSCATLSFGVRRRDLVLERASAMQMLITDSKMGRAIRSSVLNIGATY